MNKLKLNIASINNLFFNFANRKCPQHKEKQSLSMQTWTNRCSKMQLIVRMLPSKSSISKRILLPTLRKNSIRNSTPHGTVLSVETLDLMSLMKLNISSTSTWVKSQSYFSSQVDSMILYIPPITFPTFPLQKIFKEWKNIVRNPMDNLDF